MSSTDPAVLMRAAIGAVRECADTLEAQALGLERALPELRMEPSARAAVAALAEGLKDTAGRVTFELALLQAELGDGRADAAAVVQRLANLDSSLMTALDAGTDVLSQLEVAAERDEAHEPVFALVLQAVQVMLRKLGTARAATGVIDAEPPVAPRPLVPPPRVLRTADGSTVILRVGAEGGDVTLIGRAGEDGAWQFARITVDQTEALFGDEDVPITAPDLTSLVWVDGWEAGLSLMDRYPWVRLHPVYVHPEFVERVRAAVEQRLARESSASDVEDLRERWERRFEQAR